MKDLIERLEKAKEGSRELDVEIWMAAVPNVTRKQWAYTHLATGKVCDVDETRDATGRLIIVQHYTTSLDAAMTLVPEGFTLQLHQWRGGDGNTYARAVIDPEEPPTYSSESDSGTTRSLPLAITIAALKAKEASNGR